MDEHSTAEDNYSMIKTRMLYGACTTNKVSSILSYHGRNNKNTLQITNGLTSEIANEDTGILFTLVLRICRKRFKKSQSRLRSNEECVDTTVIGRPSEVDRQRDGRKVAEWIDKVSRERVVVQAAGPELRNSREEYQPVPVLTVSSRKLHPDAVFSEKVNLSQVENTFS
ncbi:hypothetical protein HZH66_006733 [Vespula vulgaris]|uniref:Uncharacterized protein n=1 Tax=Vespula vulgaris TaxID=7454 RepID=A0A834K7M9_VESVU|nr:hypothetical protein HZH66_006733 [Vespula vulgaris]